MRMVIAGDWHGNTRWAQHVIGEAGKRKISHVFVVGDCGLWPGLAGIQYLDEVNRAAQDNNLSVFFVPGNHDAYNLLERYQQMYPTHKGFTYLRERLLMCGKVNKFKLGGVQFGVAGGAVSIDKKWRVAKEQGGLRNDPFGNGMMDFGRGTGEMTLWWPQETLTDDEVAQAKAMGHVDVLLSHDCSNRTPWKGRLKPDLDSMAHRQKIDEILRATTPDVHFHGHMHEPYDWNNLVANDHWTQTYGMACDGAPNAWGVFETDNYDFALEGRGMPFRSLEEEDDSVPVF